MMPGDYYGELGLKRDASAADVRKAYKRLARKFHPDVNPGDKAAEERFKAISEAHAVLSDPEKRRAYDQFGAAGPQAGRAWGGGAGFEHAGFSAAGFAGGLGDLFSQMFGQAGRRAAGRRARGQDVEAVLRIGFMDAIRGLRTPVRIQRQEPCPACGGSGAAADGAGAACPACGGGGTQDRSESIQVRIPAGVSDGTRLRIAGRGSAGPPGAPRGDLRVTVRVGEHPVFSRKGDNIYCHLPITVAEAALGARVEVPTVDGKSMLTVPAGSRSGQQLRLRGKGAPSRRGGRGDQFVVLEVLTPDADQAEIRRLMEELARHLPPAPRQELLDRSAS